MFRILKMKLLSDRLALIYKEHPELEGDRGQTGLVRISGASKSMVNQWLTNAIKTMGLRYALELEKEFGYSHLWLMDGTGEMRPVRADAEPAERDELQWVKPNEMRMLTLFRQAGELGQEDAMILLEEVVKELQATTPKATKSSTERPR